jgi:signal transduction histidine kinase
VTLQVLVVDDDRVDQEAVRRYLSRPGRVVSVQQAANGAEGIARLRGREKFDCVFLDYNLTDMDGVDVLRRLYDPETGLGPAPIVMLTGQVRESAMMDAIHLGAQDYLIKNAMSTDILYIALAKAMGIFDLKRSQVQAEERLRQSEKMQAMGQLTSGVAHDFNNLLAIILGNIDLARDELESDPHASPSLQEKIDAIREAAHKGTDLVRRLMTFTRQRALEQQVADIGPCIRNLESLLSRTLGSTIAVKTFPALDLWPVCVDTGQFENALINMAVNARDAMPGGGSLTIEAANAALDGQNDSAVPAGDYIQVRVSDTGEGIPKERLQRIFDPFFTTKEIGHGTGLGLSMVYSFVHQSNGQIRVESQEGQGTSFSIYLPRAVQPVQAEALPPNPVTAPAPAMGQGIILLIEDDKLLRDLSVLTLKRLGYDVLPACDAHEALEILKAREGRIDLILTDIMMPGGMDGIEVVREARRHYPGLRALYTSGNADLALASRQISLEDNFIPKPCSRDMMAERIRQVMMKPAESGEC